MKGALGNIMKQAQKMQLELAKHHTADIELAVPLVSAAMDKVTEARMALAIAREGGAVPATIGVVNGSPKISAASTAVTAVPIAPQMP